MPKTRTNGTKPAPLWTAMLAVLLTIGCTGSRTSHRTASRRSSTPPPVAAPLPSTAPSEIPLGLTPTNGLDARPQEAAYGPGPSISVAPSGSTGFSSDIRFPQSRGAVPVPSPMPALRSSQRAVEPAKPATNGSSSEQRLSLPPSPGSETDASSLRSTPADSKPARPDSLASGTDTAPGIPRYTIVEPNVATGGKPTLEGLRWLKERGFNTVLNLLPAGETDPAEPATVREQGMEYLSLPVTAETLNKDTVERFNQIADEARRPLFIHDSDGSRTGAMYYLHRVLVDKVAKDAAQRQAAQIGLKAPGTGDDAATKLWLAIERYLADKP